MMELKDNYDDPMAAHYKEKFEFPFFVMVKAYAEEHDVSYSDAARACITEYTKTIRYDDIEYADAMIHAREAEGIAEVQDSSREIIAGAVKGQSK
ncbi:MAG: hypothetical protein E7233_08630 [Lachnospiraceae bacterium]|nr:hypothetical protein [Lachnospiraceae bacterium]